MLGERTSIDIADVGGYKFFAGPDSVWELSTLYANYQFECDGTGSYETFPTDLMAFIFPPVTGTFTWRPDGDQMRVDIVTSTGGESSIYDDALIGDVLNDGVFIVGESSLNGRVVSHTLQFEECS